MNSNSKIINKISKSRKKLRMQMILFSLFLFNEYEVFPSFPYAQRSVLTWGKCRRKRKVELETICDLDP